MSEVEETIACNNMTMFVGDQEYKLVNLHTSIVCGICLACDLKRSCDENHELDDFCNKFIPTGWVFKKQ